MNITDYPELKINVTKALDEKLYHTDTYSLDNLSYSSDLSDTTKKNKYLRIKPYSHTRHLSLDCSLYDLDTSLDDSFKKRNLSLDNILSVDKLTLNTTQNLQNNIENDSPSNNNTRFVLSDRALLCFKTMISPLAIFFHIGRFAFLSLSETFSFTTAFAISDLIFFSFLDKFSLTYSRYLLLAITGIVAIFSLKGIISSSINLFLSLFKGTYSWYFSLIDPNCSFFDFLFGFNDITTQDTNS